MPIFIYFQNSYPGINYKLTTRKVTQIANREERPLLILSFTYDSQTKIYNYTVNIVNATPVLDPRSFRAKFCPNCERTITILYFLLKTLQQSHRIVLAWLSISATSEKILLLKKKDDCNTISTLCVLIMLHTRFRVYLHPECQRTPCSKQARYLEFKWLQ